MKNLRHLFGIGFSVFISSVIIIFLLLIAIFEYLLFGIWEINTWFLVNVIEFICFFVGLVLGMQLHSLYKERKVKNFGF